MTIRSPITFGQAFLFTREALDLDGNLGNLRRGLRMRGSHFRARQLLARILADESAPLTAEDLARQKAVDRLTMAMREAVGAWGELQTLLREEDKDPDPLDGPEDDEEWHQFFQELSIARVLDFNEEWREMEPLIKDLNPYPKKLPKGLRWGRCDRPKDWAQFGERFQEAASLLLGNRLSPTIKHPGLSGLHAFSIAQRQDGRRTDDGQVKRAINRPAMGALYITLGAILETAFPDATPKDRGAYRWKTLEKAARRFDLVTIFPREDWQSATFRSRVKSSAQAWRKAPNPQDIEAMLEDADAFPALAEAIRKLGADSPPT